LCRHSSPTEGAFGIAQVNKAGAARQAHHDLSATMVRSTVRHETVYAKGTSTAAGLRGEGMASAVVDQLRGAHGAYRYAHDGALN
jgi:hypothetical protein